MLHRNDEVRVWVVNKWRQAPIQQVGAILRRSHEVIGPCVAFHPEPKARQEQFILAKTPQQRQLVIAVPADYSLQGTPSKHFAL